jgi:hypothetical protein
VIVFSGVTVLSRRSGLRTGSSKPCLANLLRRIKFSRISSAMRASASIMLPPGDAADVADGAVARGRRSDAYLVGSGGDSAISLSLRVVRLGGGGLGSAWHC